MFWDWLLDEDVEATTDVDVLELDEEEYVEDVVELVLVLVRTSAVYPPAAMMTIITTTITILIVLLIALDSVLTETKIH